MGRIIKSLSPLKPITDTAKRFRVVGFDTEDNGKGAPHSFILACFWSEGSEKICWSRQEARDYIMKINRAVISAHNLTYDLANIDFPEYSIRGFWKNGSMIGATNKEKQVRFMDSARFFNATIEKVGEALGIPKIENKDLLPYLKKADSKDDIPKDIQRDLEKYCMRDAEISAKAMLNIQNLCIENKARFKAFTGAALAMRIWRTGFFNDKWYARSRRMNDYERQAYYGGRTEVYDHSLIDEAFYDDIKSSYPSVMTDNHYPHPNNYSWITDPTTDDVLKYDGITTCRVDIPFMRIPPLPFRKDGKLLFPYGRIQGTWTNAELRMAIRHGCRIKAYEMCKYRMIDSPFKDYISMFFHKKETTKGIEREFYKLLLNSLYGKFNEKRNETIVERASDLTLEDLVNTSVTPQYFQKATDNDTLIYLDSVMRKPDPAHSIPIIAAHISSYARIKLYEERLSKDIHPIYTDTDSCMSLRQGERQGKKLGDWDSKRIFKVQCLAPKVYSYTDDSGNKISKHKGIPSRHTESNGMALYERPLRLAESIRRGLPINKWVPVEKTLSCSDTKRGKYSPLYIHDRTRPLSFLDTYSANS